MQRNSVPKHLLTTNPITGSKIRAGGKTFNRLVDLGIFDEHGKIKEKADVVIQAEKDSSKSRD